MGQARDNRIMLTQRALAARESFDQSRSFVVTCEPQGMPTVMNWVYPFEFSQRGREHDHPAQRVLRPRANDPYGAGGSRARRRLGAEPPRLFDRSLRG